MQLKNIIKNGIKGLGGLGLALLLNTQEANAQLGWFSSDDPKKVAGDYIEAIQDGDASDFKDCITSRYLDQLYYRTRKYKNVGPIERPLMELPHYKNGEFNIIDYTPTEDRLPKYDNVDRVWAGHNGCPRYHEVKMVKENGKWKVDAIN